jgi:hypothetical protein
MLLRATTVLAAAVLLTATALIAAFPVDTIEAGAPTGTVLVIGVPAEPSAWDCPGKFLDQASLRSSFGAA